MLQAELNYLYVADEVAQEAVRNVLAKQTAKPNFGNHGALTNLLYNEAYGLYPRTSRSYAEEAPSKYLALI